MNCPLCNSANVRRLELSAGKKIYDRLEMADILPSGRGLVRQRIFGVLIIECVNCHFLFAGEFGKVITLT